jgi:serine/threonine protein kinase
LGYVWIAYEFVDGPTLQQWVDAHRPTPTEVAMLTLPLAQGLDHVHSIDVLHRDIKPSNVILRMAQCGAPVLIDFSYAKPVGRSGLTSSRRAVGTEHYMAPEVLTHPVACSTRSDQWSLAKVVAEVIARALGTPADGLFLMRPAELVDLIRRELPDAAAALQRAFGPADTRYPTAEALATDIGLSCLGADRRAQVGPRPVPSHSRSARQLDATHSGTVPSEVFRVRARHNGRFLGMGSATVLDARRLRSDDSARSTMVRRCIVKIGTRSFDGVVYEASLKSRFTKGRGSAVYSTDGRRKLCTIYRADR